MARGRFHRRFGVALILAALAGTAAALAFARLTGPEAQRQVSRTPAKSPALGRSKQVDNRIQLSHRESLGLVSWAKRLRACLDRRGVQVGEPVAYAKQIDLRLHSEGSPTELSPTITGCGDSLGQPPRRSSLQFKPGKLVLYLPRQCLLDPKVRTPRTGTGRDA
jgi:hypothetical protein